MSDELTPKEREDLKEFYESVAKDLASGISKERIIKNLVKTGWIKEIATEFVNGIEHKIEQEVEQYKKSPEGRQAMRDMRDIYKRHMFYGALWAIGGILVTWLSYNEAAASPIGGTYIIAWGAILYGAIKFLRAVSRLQESQEYKTGVKNEKNKK